MLLVLFHLILQIILVYSDEKVITSTESSEVCDVDSSCNTTIATETTTDKVNLTDKWKYNVSEVGSVNDTVINIFHLNDSSISNISESNSQQKNQSLVNPETKSSNTKFQINYNDDCECDVTVNI